LILFFNVAFSDFGVVYFDISYAQRLLSAKIFFIPDRMTFLHGMKETSN